jgi:hypothetical protein
MGTHTHFENKRNTHTISRIQLTCELLYQGYFLSQNPAKLRLEQQILGRPSTNTSFRKSLSRRMQWERATACMEAVKRYQAF